MKTRLNLTIEQSLLRNIREYARKQKKSISELVEEYFRSLPKASGQRSFVDFINSLEKPLTNENLNLKEEYYKLKGKENDL